MQPLSRDNLSSNAFRTLGLSASATQPQIDDAARRMRIWPDERRIPPTAWDAPWLGPLGRARGDIERALSLLNEPGSRVEHRLLWYHASVPAAEAGATNMALPQRQDAALRALHGAIMADPSVTEPARWQRVVEGVTDLATSPEYAAYMARLEEAGDFEKRASAAEIYDAVDALPEALLAALVPRAQAALDRDDNQACADIAMILRAAGAASAPMRLLLDRLEDELCQQCREMDAELRDKLRTNYQYPDSFYQANREFCHTAATYYNQTVAVSLARFVKLAESDPNRIVRTRGSCAQVLALLAMGWDWSGRFVKAEQTQRVALELAQGSAGEAGIRKDLLRYQELAEQERQRDQAWGGPGNQPLEYESKRRPVTVRSAPPKKNTGAGVGGVAVVGVIIVLRMLVSMAGNSGSSSNSTYQIPKVPNLQYQQYPYQIKDRDKSLQELVDSLRPTTRALSAEALLGSNPNVTPSLAPSLPSVPDTLAPLPQPPKPRIDPARVNDPFGESSREQ